MTISAIIEHFPYLGLFILLILGGIGFPFPEDTTLILCGALIATHIVEPLPALCVVYVGLIITDLLLFLIGRKYGRKIISHPRFRKILSSERLAMLEEKFDKRGVLVVLIGRHMVGLRAQIFLAAGVLRMSLVKFVLADAVSSLFTLAIMVGIGFIGGNSIQRLKQDLTRIEHIVIIFVIIVFAVYMVVKYAMSLHNRTK